MNRKLLFASAAALAAALCALPAAVSASPSNGLPTLTLALTKNTVKVGGSEVSGAVNVVTTVTGEKSDGPVLFLLKRGHNRRVRQGRLKTRP
jgi:hypothetical protein